jgi:peptide chain release factor 1
MLFILRRITQNSQIRFYSTAAARSISKSSSPIEQLEQHGARILRIVQKRVEERANLLSQMSDDMSSPEDIKSLRQAKELEPLKMAWDNWQTNRQVRAIFLFFLHLYEQVSIEMHSFAVASS